MLKDLGAFDMQGTVGKDGKGVGVEDNKEDEEDEEDEEEEEEEEKDELDKTPAASSSSAKATAPRSTKLKIRVRPRQVKAALPQSPIPLSLQPPQALSLRVQLPVKIRCPRTRTPPIYTCRTPPLPPVASSSRIQLQDLAVRLPDPLPSSFGGAGSLVPFVAPTQVPDSLPSYKQLVAKVEVQEQELEVLRSKLCSFKAQRRVLDDAELKVSRLQEQNAHLESEGRRSAKEVPSHPTQLDSLVTELCDLRRELGSSVAEVARLERVLASRDRELHDFAKFEDFQHHEFAFLNEFSYSHFLGFAYCVCEHFISNHEVVDMVKVECQAIRGYLNTLGQLVGNETSALADSLRLVMRRLEGFADGLEKALERISLTQEEHFLPMRDGGVLSLEDRL
ncbi:hypothetical protein BDQ12DRAFT_725821 [Crucibulum laeve]|uniref:Uncharacterized protein n=1 Tax=Crucibulum laeve TaxID=68775 RepID=A0A5C3LT25_9AGAR|nr:hypothetical protein BDQ12DRAFT_725821 [Crucibulum laeve]